MMRRWLPLLAVAAVLATVVPLPGFAEELSPEEAVRRYLAAAQNQQFDKAYDMVSKAMKKDRKTGETQSKEAWVKEQQYVFQFADAKIFDFKVFPGRIEGDKALVPNILSSQDKFLNQLAVEEYELYTLVKEDGAWKVDQQQEVVEAQEIAKWFPKRSPTPKTSGAGP